MADDAAAGSGATSVPPAPRSFVDTARRVVGRMVARLPGLDGDAAQRNAWEAVCADLQRRQQWNDVVELTLNATRHPAGTPAGRSTRRPTRRRTTAPVSGGTNRQATSRAQP
ncbi:hypothetical protein [Actinopolymorpha sp. B9G3]|uniref:hypothetical protein n=1 Tax=Actinopolymorpha sp. B9G3 TaxID=3158970 RepID=UPI0032D92F28